MSGSCVDLFTSDRDGNEDTSFIRIVVNGGIVDLPSFVSSGEAARLIPVVADTSREVRATSILLATLVGVPRLAKAMLASTGQGVGGRTITRGYTEVVLKPTKDAQTGGRPDGLLTVERSGGRGWSAIVEAKIGRAHIDPEQVKRYVSTAKSHGIPAIITISNEFVALPTHHPVKLPKSLLKNVDLFHWSWMHVLTEAMLLLNSDEFENQTQRYLLQEMVRFFSHPSVGVSTHDRMNPEWRDLVLAVQTGAPLTKSSDAVINTVAAWHQETRDLSLLLSRHLNRVISLRLSRAQQADAAVRFAEDVEMLTSTYRLRSAFSVPDTAGPIQLTADIRRRSVNVHMVLHAPGDRPRASSRLNWLLRQLQKSKPEGLHVRVNWPGRAPATQTTLEAARSGDPTLLGNSSLLPSSFEVQLIRDLAGKFSGSKTFLEEVESALVYFYEQVGQHLREYVPKPPRAKQESEEKLSTIVTTESHPPGEVINLGVKSFQSSGNE